ncbi:hypothetical protein MKW92_043893 [Papaver armeniacum]|nr:hypothetical protein MKW92_043893 [Papaver armeniacum]
MVFHGLLKTCNFPAVFIFGDSTLDAGGISAAFYAIGTPNGETVFGKPSGRACDGRLVVDFMEGACAPIPDILDQFATAVQLLVRGCFGCITQDPLGVYIAKTKYYYGFVDPLDFCCCPEKVVVNGMVYGGPFVNPLKHISWDGIHYSEAANEWVAN